MEIYELYKGRKEDCEAELAGLRRRENRVIWLRTLAGLGSLGMLATGWITGEAGWFYGAILPALAFLVLVGRHEDLKGRIRYQKNLIAVNDMGMARQDGRWTAFPITGKEYLEPGHPYARDLHLFGEGSLFQFLNAAATFQGERILAHWLKQGVVTEELPKLQEAVRDLAGRLDWRQGFQAAGMGEGLRAFDPAPLTAWAEGESLLARHPWLRWAFLLPLATLGCFLAAKPLGIPAWFLTALLAAQMAVAGWGERIGGKAFRDTEAAVRALARYAVLLQRMEGEKFQAPYLRRLQRGLRGEGEEVSKRLERLSRIADRITYRYSPLVHFFLNILTLWDIFTLKRLEAWKAASGPLLARWLEALGRLEALASLAGLAHDNPGWTYPRVGEGNPNFEGIGLGHPLIPAKERVNNDVLLSRPGDVAIITGSNMSGKSTLLRTVGVNLVLAYGGAPVCAQRLDCTRLRLYTAMQVEDSLQEHTSAFFAELKRLKLLVDGAKRGEAVLFLLDEFFKGTNSGDRITGARKLISRLHQLGAVGMVTTHDLEVARLEEEHPEYIRNFHFTDELRDDRIEFDYRLKPGVCRKTNAMALMRLMGIDP